MSFLNKVKASVAEASDKVKAGVAEASDKVKAGVAEAGSKAKTLVEVNRLKLANHSKLNEIEAQYREIGKIVYSAGLAQSEEAVDSPEMKPYFDRIKCLQDEIEHNLKEIKFISEGMTIESDETDAVLKPLLEQQASSSADSSDPTDRKE
ncbi:hypothetical protein [Paenibacillus sp. NPDC058071]|uniref:hypothetical protein n=1 Tax=Paenibacillus sp. NPDC058071 TaxID=3346326 RepID=UPI0036DCA6B4